MQLLFPDQPLDHVITGNQDIIGGTGGQFGIHLLVGGIPVIVYLDAVLFFKVVNDVHVDVFAPVVDVQRLAGKGRRFGFNLGFGFCLGGFCGGGGRLGFLLLAAGQQQAQDSRQDQGKDFQGLLHVHSSSLLAFFSVRRGIRFTRISTTATTATIMVESALTV